MAYTLEQFCADCRKSLQDDPGPGGRERIRLLVEKALADQAFVARHLGPDAPLGRHTLYEDKDLKFVVLAHINKGAHKSPPHDHGRSWAVYGQAAEYTDMTEWKRADGGAGAGKAELQAIRAYRLTPGKAGTYDVGAIHSIDYPDNARFLRVTGEDLDKVERLKFNLAEKRAEVIESVTVG